MKKYKVVARRSAKARSISKHKNLELARSSAKSRANRNNRTYHIYNYATTTGGLRRQIPVPYWRYVESISPRAGK